MRSQYIEINTTTPVLPLQVSFQPMAYWKFSLFATMTASFAEAAKQQGSAGSAELDEIKRMLVETNPYFLGLTALVSILHVVCVFMAPWRPICTNSTMYTASRCWRLPPTYRIGGKSRNSLACLSGEQHRGLFYGACDESPYTFM